MIKYPKLIKTATEKLANVREDVKERDKELIDNPEFAITIGKATYTAVSYTHLDVYKRQVYLFLQGNTSLRHLVLMSLRWTDSVRMMRSLMPNTGKDVYKRQVNPSSARWRWAAYSCREMMR